MTNRFKRLRYKHTKKINKKKQNDKNILLSDKS